MMVAAMHDRDTQVFTNRGLLTIDEVDGGDKILQYHPITNSFDFVLPIRKIVQDYEGDMVHFKSHHFDIKVTPDHAVYHALYRRHLPLRWGTLPASEACNYHRGYFLALYFGRKNRQSIVPIDVKISRICKVESYKGKIWCFTVPSGLFVTRRHGKSTIQGT